MSNKLLFNQATVDKVTYLHHSPNNLAVIDENFNYIEFDKVDDSLYYKILKADNYSEAPKIFSHKSINDAHYFIKKEKVRFVYFIAVVKDSDFSHKLYNLRKSFYDEKNKGH